VFRVWFFLSTGAKRAAQRQHWNLGVRGLTTIQQGFDFVARPSRVCQTCKMYQNVVWQCVTLKRGRAFCIKLWIESWSDLKRPEVRGGGKDIPSLDKLFRGLIDDQCTFDLLATLVRGALILFNCRCWFCCWLLLQTVVLLAGVLIIWLEETEFGNLGRQERTCVGCLMRVATHANV